MRLYKRSYRDAFDYADAISWRTQSAASALHLPLIISSLRRREREIHSQNKASCTLYVVSNILIWHLGNKALYLDRRRHLKST